MDRQNCYFNIMPVTASYAETTGTSLQVTHYFEHCDRSYSMFWA